MTKVKLDKNKITNAAIAVSDKKGFTNISLKEVAESLNIKTPSLYNHISGLEELYDLIVHEGLKQLLDKLVSAAIGRSGKSALLAIGEAYLDFACSSQSLYLAAQLVPVYFSDKTKKQSDEIVNLMLKIISVYNFSSDQEIHVVRILRSYLHGFALLKSQDSFQIDLDINKSFEIGLQSLLVGLELN